MSLFQSVSQKKESAKNLSVRNWFQDFANLSLLEAWYARKLWLFGEGRGKRVKLQMLLRSTFTLCSFP
jgi:hypothetical protein